MTIAYVNPPATRISRRAQLKTNYFFDCNCDRCEKEGAAMESAEAVGPPQTVKAASESDSCADRVAQAGEILKAGGYEEALCLLLGDEDIDEHSSGGLSQREHLGMVAGTLGAAVPAMVAEVCANQSLLFCRQLSEAHLIQNVWCVMFVCRRMRALHCRCATTTRPVRVLRQRRWHSATTRQQRLFLPRHCPHSILWR